jgi:hypothetical protein
VAGGLASGLGRATRQPGLRRPIHHLTTRQHNKLTVTQAQAVIAAAVQRHLHAVVTTGRRWDPVIATRGTRGTSRGDAHRNLTSAGAARVEQVGASPTRH